MTLQLPLCQRWLSRRPSFRPGSETIDPSRYGVELLTEAEARAFVVENHYSASYPAARCRVGLYRTSGVSRDLVGVAVFSVPAGPKVLSTWLPHLANPLHGVELGRFVLLDDVPGNGETWFLARAFAALRSELPDVRAVVSFSDPVQRASTDGRLVMPGHVGTIYQAHNAAHLGRTSPRSCWLDREGRIVSERALSKLRTDDRGAAYAYEALLAAGAPARVLGEAGPAYVARALQEGPFRRLRHAGNLAYAWKVGKAAAVPGERLPYPKADDCIVKAA